MRPALTHCHGSPPWTTRLRLGLGWRPTIVRVTMSSSVIRVAFAAACGPVLGELWSAEMILQFAGAYDDCVSGREATVGPSYRC